MSLIDISYFVGDLKIPNSADAAVIERVNWYIQKYEPEFLRHLLGYPLYKAFLAALNVVPPAVPDQRMISILYGTEYTDLRGYLTRWRGLIDTDNPVFNLAGEYVYKRPVYLTSGTTPGLVPGAASATFDGTAGTDDWRGWTPIITRATIMKPGIDYSWDIDTGELDLLKAGDKFGMAEDYFVQFQLRTDPVPSTDVSASKSLIADYIYYWYYRAAFTQSTGLGEVQINAENAVNQSPKEKSAQAWNDMSDWVHQFVAYMDTMNSTDPKLYPEWLSIHRYEILRRFAFANPFF